MADVKRVGRFFLCVVGVWGSFFIWGLLQERITTRPYEVNGEMKVFRSPFVIGFLQAFLSLAVSVAMWLFPVLFSSSHPTGGNMTLPADSAIASPTSPGGADMCGNVNKGVEGRSTKSITSFKGLMYTLCDWRKFTASSYRAIVSIGLTMTFGAPFGYAAIRAGMPYPIMITVKLGKMIPIVVVSTLVHRIRYPPIKYAITALITAGVVWFAMEDDAASGDTKGKKAASAADYAPIFGTLLVIINLFMDGFTASSQDVLIKTLHIQGNTLQLLSNVSCAAWTLAALIAFEFMPANKYTAPELSGALAFFTAAPDAFYEVVLMALLNAVGQVFIFQTISHFGTLTLTAITVTRKTGSVFLSIFMNGHVLKTNQFCAMGLVLAGVALETYDSIMGKKKKGHGHGHSHGHGKAVSASPVAGTVAEKKKQM